MEDLRRRSFAAAFASVIVAALGIFSIFLIDALNPKKAPDFSYAADIDAAAAEELFLRTPSNENLYVLMQVLCYQTRHNPGIQDYWEKLDGYGDELYCRAKAGRLDLETVGDPKVAAEILDWLRLRAD